MKVATEPVSQAEVEIKAAWLAYQKVKKYGLEFGETVYKWRERRMTSSRLTSGRIRNK